MKNGDRIILVGTLSTVHQDGSAYVALRDGQNVYTSLANLDPYAVELERVVEEGVEATLDTGGKIVLVECEPADFDKMKIGDLREKVKEMGVPWGPSDTAQSLRVKIRAALRTASKGS